MATDKERQARQEFVDDLHAIARLIQAYPEIPVRYNSLNLEARVTLFMYPGTDEEQAQTKTALARIASRIKRHAKVEKKYYGSSFQLEILPRKDSKVKLILSTNREAVCEKKVVGTEYVPPSAGYTREIIEWECSPLLAPEAK